MLNRGQTFEVCFFVFFFTVVEFKRGKMYKDVLKNYFIKLSLHFSTSNELFLLKSLLGRVMYRTASDPKTAN